MAQQPIELILMRELAEHLATAMFVVDSDGNLEFCNEAAEKLLGLRFDDTGPMPATEWGTVFAPTDEQGRALAADDLPLAITLRHRQPCHGSLAIRGHDGVERQLAVTALPLIGQHGTFVGAAALFWEPNSCG